MLAKQFFSFLFLSFVALTFGNAQSIMLDSVYIIEKSFYGDFPRSETRDSFSKKQFTDKIQQTTTGQLRQTTPGGLTTFLYRGFSTRHLPVMWNGFNIQSITNGSFDLSLIPGFYFHDVGFQSNMISSLVGNNVFSGGFVMAKNQNNVPRFFTEIDLSTLQNYGFQTGVSLRKKNTILNLGFIRRIDKNIFSFDSSGSVVKRLPTDFVNTQVGAEIAHQFNHSLSGGIDIWYQHGKRNVLNDTFFVFGSPIQKDRNLKSNIYLQYQSSSYLLKWNAVYSKENLIYEDSSQPIPFSSTADVTAIQNTVAFYQKKFAPLHIYLRHRYDLAEANFFEEERKRSTFQAGGSWFTEWPNQGKFQMSARQDLVDGKLYIPSLRLDMGHYGYMLHLYNNYQLPNFNDLYYPFSGNPDLRSETAINAEITKTFNWKTRKLRAEIFAYWINDLIQWIPVDSTGWNWSPFNQEFVFSRGFELDYTAEVNLKKGQIRYGVSYGYTAAEIRKHKTVAELEGKQIIFMPRHKAQANLGYRLKYHDVYLMADWTGKRFIAADNSVSLPSFLVLNLAYEFRFRQLGTKIELQNLLNERYQLINGFPMPGMYARFSIRYFIQ